MISRIIKAEVGVAMLCNSIIYTYENQPVEEHSKNMKTYPLIVLN